MKTINIYTINEHPNPTKVFDWVRDNFEDILNIEVQSCCEQMASSIKALAVAIDGTYSHLEIADYNKEKLD